MGEVVVDLFEHEDAVTGEPIVLRRGDQIDIMEVRKGEVKQVVIFYESGEGCAVLTADELHNYTDLRV